MVVVPLTRSQIDRPRGQIHFYESVGAVPPARRAVSPQDGFLGAARRLVPGAAAPACARRGPGYYAGRARHFQYGVFTRDGRSPPVGTARLQRGVVDRIDVRGVKAFESRDGV